MEKFFKDVMLEENGIFTLLGTKPITAIPLYLYTDEELKAYYDQLSAEEQDELLEVVDYNVPRNWEEWEKIQSRFPIRNYLFFKKIDILNPRVPVIYFVNIQKTTALIQEHYALFRNEMGFDFDPVMVVLEFEKGSPFWDKVLNHSVLQGLLYGFGKENAFAFKHAEKGSQHHFSDAHRMGKASLHDFPIPIFASFSEKDDVIDKYIVEREEIRRKYKGNDFLNFTLQKLTSP